MGIGSTLAVEEAEEQYREDCAKQIARTAAPLVAAGDMGRDDAIRTVTEWLRQGSEAEGDVTGVVSVQNKFPTPSKEVATKQVAAIVHDLLDAARAAADTL
ncbi:hypothetical protein [Crenobacter cavernae]|uniref:Uncharacterized protein n=1 Tax=Crenobacter cavernae TaxID=2290923 RepID=A0A345Y3M6_9NEIS|nr:hypothetical protein [Crenobacter cavernae]AXK38528.1 hypothetical protein DWG20_03295 [Crenobacter cavernae]